MPFPQLVRMRTPVPKFHPITKNYKIAERGNILQPYKSFINFLGIKNGKGCISEVIAYS